MNNHRSIILLITLLGMYGSLSAQNICSQNLLTAQRKYDQGQLMEVNNLLDACLENGFSKAEKIQAYRLSILSLLFQDEQEQAGELMVKLIKIQPDYSVNPAVDPTEYIKLFYQYRAVPILTLGAKVGLNRTTTRTLQRYGLENTSSVTQGTVVTPTFSFGLTTSTAIYKRLLLSLDVLYSGRTFGKVTPLYGFAELSSTEEQVHLELPVGITYIHGRGQYRPYIQAGIAPAYLLQSNLLLELVDKSNGSNIAIGPAEDVTSIRKSTLFSLFGSLGVRRKLATGELFFEVRYTYGLTNIPLTETRFTADQKINGITSRYNYIDDDFTINNLSFSVGFLQTFYRIKKTKIKYAQ
jgi:hypothetical protein